MTRSQPRKWTRISFKIPLSLSLGLFSFSLLTFFNGKCDAGSMRMACTFTRERLRDRREKESKRELKNKKDETESNEPNQGAN